MDRPRLFLRWSALVAALALLAWGVAGQGVPVRRFDTGAVEAPRGGPATGHPWVETATWDGAVRVHGERWAVESLAPQAVLERDCKT